MTATKSKVKTLHFSITGEGTTNIIRDSWVSDIPKHALKICKEGFYMTTEQALQVITGKKKLVGDTRDGDGTLSWEDDNSTEYHGVPLSLEVMITRLENKFVDISESINIFNGVSEDISDDDFESNMKILNGHKEKLANLLEQIQEVYSLVGKTMKDLPVDKIRSSQNIKSDYKKEHREEFEMPANRNLSDYDKKFDDVMRNTQMAILSNMEENKKEKESVKETDINDSFSSMGGGKFYIVNTPVEKCKTEGLHSGWLLPDGTFFGGRSIWIHKGILDELYERDYFKDKGYSADEDDVQERGGWIKVSNSEWMIWEHKVQPTKEQVEFIIQYTIKVTESNFIRLSMRKIHVQVLAEMLNGRAFDSYEMAHESDGMEELKKEDNFPSEKEVSDIDVMCTPFFVPDTDFVKWLIGYANGRVIVDCGAGSGYLCALIQKHGGKVIGIEPQWTMERKIFWMERKYMFNVLAEQSEKSMVLSYPPEKSLFLFARPCHSGFVEKTIKKLQKGSEALYISHGEENRIVDIGYDIPYTKLNHEGTSKDNEYVLSIKK